MSGVIAVLAAFVIDLMFNYAVDGFVGHGPHHATNVVLALAVALFVSLCALASA